jgi:hypothetical protein
MQPHERKLVQVSASQGCAHNVVAKAKLQTNPFVPVGGVWLHEQVPRVRPKAIDAILPINGLRHRVGNGAYPLRRLGKVVPERSRHLLYVMLGHGHTPSANIDGPGDVPLFLLRIAQDLSVEERTAIPGVVEIPWLGAIRVRLPGNSPAASRQTPASGRASDGRPDRLSEPRS